jgi:hypothetical protein
VVDVRSVLATQVRVEKGRAPLQAAAIERLGPPVDGQIPVWLFVADPGHFRVLSQKDIAGVMDLDAFNSADALTLGTREQRERLGALRLRLIPTAVVPEKRLKIPCAAFDICGEYLDRTHVWLELSPAGIDVFTATYVQKAMAVPPSLFLPGSFDPE